MRCWLEHTGVSDRLNRAIRPVMEGLEGRRLLSIAISGSTVTARGTNGDDTVTLSRVNGDPSQYEINVNGDVETFDRSDVSLFRIDLLGGDDEFELDDSFGSVPAKRSILGGDGDDSITSAGGRDTILGGADDDSIFGGGSGDKIFGDSGNDTIDGGASGDSINGGNNGDSLLGNDGHDTLLGGKGNDRLFGGKHNDLIVAGAGDDTVDAGSGNDFAYGDAGNDTLAGGKDGDVLGGDSENVLTFQGDDIVAPVPGDDRLNGSSGNDTLLAHTGDDTLAGGSGGDLFDARGGDDTLIDKQPAETLASEAVFDDGDPVVSDEEINLRIIIDGDEVFIPEGAGDFDDGDDISVAVATDDEGTIRFRDGIPRTFRLAEFFQSWGVTFDGRHIARFLETNDLIVSMTVNGDAEPDLEDYVINDGDEIVIRPS